MGLLSFFKRNGAGAAGNAASGAPAEPVQEARTRARRRLIGAVVLVGIGVIGFPLVFETRPRPIPVDIQVDIPRKETAPPLPMPPVARAVPAVPAVPVAPRDNVVTEDKGDAGKEVPPPASAPAAAPAAPPAPKPLPKPAPAVVEPGDGARAKALLEGKDKPGTKVEATRFVLQFGAFADVTAARETRARVEKAGLKTYTQVAQTPGGSRIRVRVGPFASREEAEKARDKAASAGLKAVVMTL